MPAPLALQLYTLRELAESNYEQVVRTVAEIGYAGVEPAGFPGSSPEQAGKLFKSLGLVVPSAHLPIPLGENKQLSLDTAHALDTKRLISGFGPDQFDTLDKIKSTCDKFNEAAEVATTHGMTYGIHNHWWEFIRVEGRWVYEVMVEHLSPEVFFEADIYWIQTGGADPIEVVKLLGDRAPILHIKDGPCDRESDMTAVGEGVVDIPGVIAAGSGHTKWHIVELDRCATDMVEAVQKSYRYLVDNNLAEGNR
jgi:sugar phosphate isomerase/epimerase